MAERTIAWLVRNNRRCPYRGIHKNRHWLALRAAAANLTRLTSLGLHHKGTNWPSPDPPGTASTAPDPPEPTPTAARGPQPAPLAERTTLTPTPPTATPQPPQATCSAREL